MKHNIIYLYLTLIFLFLACKQKAKEEPIKENKVIEELSIVMKKNGITLREITNQTAYNNASLNLISPKDSLLNVGEQTFRFQIENYELGINTPDPLSGECANSGKGQHIHFIWNNEPYLAFYESEFNVPVKKGNHVMLSFLSRSYHLSVKNKNAYVLKDFHTKGYKDNFDETAPHMFYSRPKGTYEGADAKKVILDFYLVNVDLESDAYSIIAEIDSTSFVIKKWAPFTIEGLVEGEHTVKLSLMDADSNLVVSPFNPVERNFSTKNTADK